MQVKSIAELEHSAILLTCIRLPFVLAIFKWPLYTGFTVNRFSQNNNEFANANGINKLRVGIHIYG